MYSSILLKVIETNANGHNNSTDARGTHEQIHAAAEMNQCSSCLGGQI